MAKKLVRKDLRKPGSTKLPFFLFPFVLLWELMSYCHQLVEASWPPLVDLGVELTDFCYNFYKSIYYRFICTLVFQICLISFKAVNTSLPLALFQGTRMLWRTFGVPLLRRLGLRSVVHWVWWVKHHVHLLVLALQRWPNSCLPILAMCFVLLVAWKQLTSRKLKSWRNISSSIYLSIYFYSLLSAAYLCWLAQQVNASYFKEYQARRPELDQTEFQQSLNYIIFRYKVLILSLTIIFATSYGLLEMLRGKIKKRNKKKFPLCMHTFWICISIFLFCLNLAGCSVKSASIFVFPMMIVAFSPDQLTFKGQALSGENNYPMQRKRAVAAIKHRRRQSKISARQRKELEQAESSGSNEDEIFDSSNTSPSKKSYMYRLGIQAFNFYFLIGSIVLCAFTLYGLDETPDCFWIFHWYLFNPNKEVVNLLIFGWFVLTALIMFCLIFYLLSNIIALILMMMTLSVCCPLVYVCLIEITLYQIP